MSLINSIISLIVLSLTSTFSWAGVIVLDGTYMNQNIYVKNSISGSGVGYCTYEVTINGNTNIDEVNSNSFEIDLEQHQLEIGTPLTVKIFFKDDGCNPQVLNPHALSPHSTFSISTMKLTEKGRLTWETANETASLPFIVEQFRWNKWVKVGEVDGKGTPEEHLYFFNTQLHAGLNTFRLRQNGFYGPRYSKSVTVRSFKTEVSFVYNRKVKSVEFSEPTLFEIYDRWGNIVKKGFGHQILVGDLKKDLYYMNMGNTTGKFQKR